MRRTRNENSSRSERVKTLVLLVREVVLDCHCVRKRAGSDPRPFGGEPHGQQDKTRYWRSLPERELPHVLLRSILSFKEFDGIFVAAPTTHDSRALSYRRKEARLNFTRSQYSLRRLREMVGGESKLAQEVC